MAIYHLSAKVISRKNGRTGPAFRVGDKICGGRSVIASAAYRSGTCIHDERLEQDFDYRGKQVDEVAILLPEGAPSWAASRSQLWNAVEAAEKRVDSQLARELEIALPRELSPEQQSELLRGFLQDHCVSRGMIADLAIHRDNPGNPHAHVLLSLRGVTSDGFGPKRRDWNDKAMLLTWRHAWEIAANNALSRAGFDESIDHRSFAERGVDLEPTSKIGRAPALASDDSFVAERVQFVRDVARRNGEKLEVDPSRIIGLLPSGKPAFTKQDLAKVVSQYTEDDAQFHRVFAKLLGGPALLDLGVGDDGQRRYTTQDKVLDLSHERSIKELGKVLQGQEHHNVAGASLTKALSTMAAGGVTLSGEQEEALRHIVTDSGRLALIQGHAGTGKSVALGAARLAWQADGLEVLGGAIAGKAAEGLQEGSGIPSRTIAAWLKGFDKGTLELTSRSVLVIDEAGMVGNTQMLELMRAVNKAGAKLVLVGDHGQLQPIDHGTPMRVLVEQVGAATMAHIRRQKVEWQRQASRKLADADVSSALKLYTEHGNIRASATKDDATTEAALSWARDQIHHPGCSQLLLAYRRADVRYLNALARAYRVERKELEGGILVQTDEDKLQVAVGERLYFLRNDSEMGVTNGTLGTVRAIQEKVLQVELDNGAVVDVDTSVYRYLAHGYAATIHKAQGVTVDRAYVVADKLLDRHATYVALTRHRHNVEVHYAEEDFASPDKLGRTLGAHSRRDRGVKWEDTKALSEYLDGPGERAPKTREQVFRDLDAGGQDKHLAKLRRILRRPAPELAVEPTEADIKKHAEDTRWYGLERKEAQRELTSFGAIVEERESLELRTVTPEELEKLRTQAAKQPSEMRAEWTIKEVRDASLEVKAARKSLRASNEYIVRAAAVRRLADSKHRLQLLRTRPDIQKRVSAIRSEQQYRQQRAQQLLRRHAEQDRPTLSADSLPPYMTRKEFAAELAKVVPESDLPWSLRDHLERGVVRSVGGDLEGEELFTTKSLPEWESRSSAFDLVDYGEKRKLLKRALMDFYGPVADATEHKEAAAQKASVIAGLEFYDRHRGDFFEALGERFDSASEEQQTVFLERFEQALELRPTEQTELSVKEDLVLRVMTSDVLRYLESTRGVEIPEAKLQEKPRWTLNADTLLSHSRQSRRSVGLTPEAIKAPGALPPKRRPVSEQELLRQQNREIDAFREMPYEAQVTHLKRRLFSPEVEKNLQVVHGFAREARFKAMDSDAQKALLAEIKKEEERSPNNRTAAEDVPNLRRVLDQYRAAKKLSETDDPSAKRKAKRTMAMARVKLEGLADRPAVKHQLEAALGYQHKRKVAAGLERVAYDNLHKRLSQGTYWGR